MNRVVALGAQAAPWGHPGVLLGVSKAALRAPALPDGDCESFEPSVCQSSSHGSVTLLNSSLLSRAAL